MQVYDAFIEVLKQENQLICELLSLGEQKQEVINDVQQVAKIAGHEQTILQQLHAVEQERHQLFDVIAPGLTLSQYLEQLPVSDGLQTISATLKENMAQLKSLNDLNKQLLDESLAFVQFSLSLLVDDSPRIYARQGQPMSNKSLFDRKV